MPVSKTKNLSSLFRAAIKATSSPIPKADHVVPSYLPANCSIQFPKGKTLSKEPQLSDTLKPRSSPHSVAENSAKDLSQEISALLCDDTSSNTSSLPDSSAVNIVNIAWVQSLSQNKSILYQKEISRDRKENWVFKKSQPRRFKRIVNLCGEKLGADATIDVFGKLGRDTGIKEYNALIGLCIKNSKKTNNEEVKLEQISKAYKLLKLMREQGLQLEEETYGQFLTYFIDKGMVEEFKFYCEFFRQENPNSFPRLAYYEMHLWVRLDDEDKIKELCDFVAINEDANNSSIRENCLLALCESERKELLELLDIIDITKIQSIVHLATIFRSLAKLSLEPFAKKFILALKTCNISPENVSKLIYDYAVTKPNLAVQDAILKFNSLHEECGVKPASALYEKLIEHCCILLKVHVALDIIDHMFEMGLTLSLESFHLLLQTCEESCDYNLVHRIYSVIRHNKLKPTNETFRIMISLSVRMKDFEGAYNMIKDMEEMHIKPTTNIYNTIMAAHFREENIRAGLQVFEEMERAFVNPDFQTFSYLIGNCDREEDITKYYERVKLLKQPGVQITKHVFMALINAYSSCGQLEKAKQVVLEEGIPWKNLNEVKSVLVSALACHGDVFNALSMYEEIKKSEGHTYPKTIICLIENLRSKEHLSKMLDLLKDFNDTAYWIEGCCRVIVHCVQYRDLRSTVDLMKQLKDKFCDDDIATENLFDEAFCKIVEMKQADMQFGMDLLQSIKKELGVSPSRQSLDFLLHACIGTKDLETARVIWKEYEAAQLPYNVFNYLRMYQVFLACGDRQSARKMKTKIPLDDPHIRCVLKACQTAYKKPKKKEEHLYCELMKAKNLGVKKVGGIE